MDGNVLLRTVIATLVAILGGGLGALAAGAARERMAALIGIASGALLAITVVGLLPEAASTLSPVPLVLSVAAGYTLFYLIGRYVYPVCPACAEEEITERWRKPHSLRKTALLLGIALTLHSVADGIAVAAAQPHHRANEDALPMLLAVSLHKLPEGLALVTLLLGAGITRQKAFWSTALVESTTILGGMVGDAALTGASPYAFGLLMAHLAGSFLYLAFHALAGTRQAGPAALQTQLRFGTLGFGAVALLLQGLQALPHPH